MRPKLNWNQAIVKAYPRSANFKFACTFDCWTSLHVSICLYYFSVTRWKRPKRSIPVPFIFLSQHNKGLSLTLCHDHSRWDLAIVCYRCCIHPTFLRMVHKSFNWQRPDVERHKTLFRARRHYTKFIPPKFSWQLPPIYTNHIYRRGSFPFINIQRISRNDPRDILGQLSVCVFGHLLTIYENCKVWPLYKKNIRNFFRVFIQGRKKSCKWQMFIPAITTSVKHISPNQISIYLP